jgi:hypothetical protein
MNASYISRSLFVPLTLLLSPVLDGITSERVPPSQLHVDARCSTMSYCILYYFM